MIWCLLSVALLHENSVSSSRIDVKDREAYVTFTFSLEDLGTLGRLDLDRDGMVSREEWGKVLPQLLSYVAEHFQIDSGAEHCRSSGDATRLPSQVSLKEGRTPIQMQMRYRASHEISRLSIRCTLFREHGGNPRHVAEMSNGTVIIFDRDRTTSDETAVQGSPQPLKWRIAGILATATAMLGLVWSGWARFERFTSSRH